jgi:hypothetical protein
VEVIEAAGDARGPSHSEGQVDDDLLAHVVEASPPGEPGIEQPLAAVDIEVKKATLAIWLFSEI